MDILQLYEDYNVDYLTEGSKHCRPGWVNTPCPFCSGNEGYHLGASLDGKVFHCWRCGLHWPNKAVSKILKVNAYVAEQLIKEYAGYSIIKNIPIELQQKAFKYPTSTEPLLDRHARYLTRRKFDPDKIQAEWNVMSTGPVSFLDKISYSHRILAPIYWNGKLVTFQARDVTNKHKLKYMACPKDRELIHHKHIVYRHPEADKQLGICVEGITDVWRFGKLAFCTFGIEFTRAQARVISNLYDEVVVIFDSEPLAQIQAKKIMNSLRFKGIKTRQYFLKKGDPGSLSDREAQQIIKNL